MKNSFLIIAVILLLVFVAIIVFFGISRKPKDTSNDLPQQNQATPVPTDYIHPFELKEINKVIYNYGDSSVPPQYHRSYEIIATNDKISIVVDSYGEVLSEKSYELDEKKFNMLKEKFFESGIKNIEDTTDSGGCTGGTTESIKILGTADSILFEGNVYHCGEGNYGSLEGDMAGFSSSLISLIPEFEELINVEYLE